MRNRNIKQAKAIAKLMLIAVLIYSLALLVSYERAKAVAIKHLQIINLNKDTYQEVKEELYDSVTPEVQELLFGSSEYKGSTLPPIRYTVDSIRGSIIGYRHYVFRITWTLKYTHTIDSLIYIKNEIVYDALRADD